MEAVKFCLLQKSGGEEVEVSCTLMLRCRTVIWGQFEGGPKAGQSSSVVGLYEARFQAHFWDLRFLRFEIHSFEMIFLFSSFYTKDRGKCWFIGASWMINWFREPVAPLLNKLVFFIADWRYGETSAEWSPFYHLPSVRSWCCLQYRICIL